MVDLVGSMLREHYRKLGGKVRAAFYPESQARSLREEGKSANLEIETGNVLDPDHNRKMLKRLDGFIYLVAIPIHYVDKKKAPMIFAVNVLGSLSMALAAHEERKARRANEDGQKLRMIMTSSVSSIWMANTIRWLKAKPNTTKTAEELEAWLETAKDDFLGYVKQRHANKSGMMDPVEFVRQYIIAEPGSEAKGHGKTLSEIVKDLENFDYYALSKLLMDKVLEQMDRDGLVENTIVIQPASIMGEGLQGKDDPGFTSKMVSRLYHHEKDDVWTGRFLYYLPVETLIKILDGLLLVPEDKLGGKIKTIQLPGNEILHEDAFHRYIYPITKAKLKEIGQDVSHLEDVIGFIVNPHPGEAENRVLDVHNIDPLIQEWHQINEDLLPDLFTKIIGGIVDKWKEEDEKAARQKNPAMVPSFNPDRVPGIVNAPGGIDLTPSKMDIAARNSGEAIHFNIDHAMLQRLQNASGVTPVIINIQPLGSLPQFFGLSQSVTRTAGG